MSQSPPPNDFPKNAAQLRKNMQEKADRRARRGFVGSMMHALRKRVTGTRNQTVRQRSKESTSNGGGKRRTLRKKTNKRKTKKNKREE